ncbi:MAG: efflux RND transporter periplasmic adaptor subunit [Bacteroidetes bacterium]|nr:MAG: efflux RND transporter periplasmic adaptor subunit [Bacteroidota bacterium]
MALLFNKPDFKMKKIMRGMWAFLMLTLLLGCGETPAPIVLESNPETNDSDASGVVTLTKTQFELGKMKTDTLTDYRFPNTIWATGMVEVPVKDHVRVSAYAGGYVKEIGLVPAQRVRKGAVLFTLENPEFVTMQQDFLEAKEQLNYLLSEYERLKTLAGENIAAQKNYLKAESEYRVTLTRMEGLKKRLALLHIDPDRIDAQNMVSSIAVVAPVSGYVTKVRAMRGMFLNPSDVAVEMVDPSHLHLSLNVFEKDIMKVKKGQPIRFKIPDSGTTTYSAEVFLIGKEVDEKNRTIEVHGHLEESLDNLPLVPGMFVEAEIIADEKTAKALPESAVIDVDGESYILVLKNKSEEGFGFVQKKITTGRRDNGMIEVQNASALPENAQILVEGAFNLIGGE